MTTPENLRLEETLDPQDWDSLKELGHHMIDDMMTHLQTIRERPAWQQMPSEVRDYFKQPMPQEAQNEEAVYQDFTEKVLPYPLGNTHPRFWGWVIGTGTPMGALAELLAASMNPNVGGGDHSANLVEEQVLQWCKEMMDYPLDASGILVSGGSMANLVGLTVARNAKAEVDIRTEGTFAMPRRMMVYGSTEMHSSMQKSLEMLGLGTKSLRKIPTNDAFEIDIEALKAAIAEDRANGLYPYCVVGNAGTVNTGAFDDLNALADLCAEENLWFHVDGAFGALVHIAPKYAHLTNGMNRADSLAFDLHKWMYMPIEIGCALVRHHDTHYNTFTLTPTYLTHGTRGAASGDRWFSDYGVQLSRSFRALKAWMSFKNYGFQKYQRLIQQNIEQIQYLGQLADAHPSLENVAPYPSNIACFRYVVEGWDKEQLNALNKELVILLHERGIAVPSGTMVRDIYAVRVANTNHRTRHDDMEALIEAVVQIGEELASA